jgi:hypothetical protein
MLCGNKILPAKSLMSQRLVNSPHSTPNRHEPTDVRHYPPEKVAQTQFSITHALREAEKIGPDTLALVAQLLGGSYPLKLLRRSQGILRLYQSGRVSREGLEHASRMAMQFNKPCLQYVQSAAEHFDKNGNRPRVVRSAPVRDPNQMYLHNQSPDYGQET